MDTLTAPETPWSSRRSEQRTNILILATFATAAMNGPARIRNLSPNGALIEADELPNVGERIRLRRGVLSVAGKVVRQEGKQVGILFDRSTAIEAWLSAGNSKQREVDRVFQEAKHRYPVADRQHLSEGGEASGTDEKKELLDMAERLDLLADALSGDAEVVGRYMLELQVLDAASQKFRGLA